MNKHYSIKVSIIYKAIVLVLLILGILVSANEVYAQSSSVTVQYNPQEVSPEPSPDPVTLYQMEIVVGEHGALYDGTAHIEGYQTIYELPAGESKTFQMEPDYGYMLNRIVFDGQNITAQVNEEDTFTITMPDHSAQLEVLFKKNPDVQGIYDEDPPTDDDSDQDSDDNNLSGKVNSGGNNNRYQPSRTISIAKTARTSRSVKTGDTSLWLIWLLLAVASVTAAPCLLYRKKRQRRP